MHHYKKEAEGSVTSSNQLEYCREKGKLSFGFFCAFGEVIRMKCLHTCGVGSALKY